MPALLRALTQDGRIELELQATKLVTPADRPSPNPGPSGRRDHAAVWAARRFLFFEIPP